MFEVLYLAGIFVAALTVPYAIVHYGIIEYTDPIGILFIASFFILMLIILWPLTLMSSMVIVILKYKT